MYVFINYDGTNEYTEIHLIRSRVNTQTRQQRTLTLFDLLLFALRLLLSVYLSRTSRVISPTYTYLTHPSNMASSSTPNYIPSPNPVHSGAFSYDKDGLQLDGIPRASLHELKLVFRTYTPRNPTKAWIIAQLKLFGLEGKIKKSDKGAVLMGRLEDYVKSGKVGSLFFLTYSLGYITPSCDKPLADIHVQSNYLPPELAELEKSLSKQYEEQSWAYTKDVNRERDAKFAKLGSPIEEAKHDPHRFLAKYFLDGLHGKPSPEKTRKAMILKNGTLWGLANAAEDIPGLKVHQYDWIQSITVIGWEDCFEAGMDEAFASLAPSKDSFDHASDMCVLDEIVKAATKALMDDSLPDLPESSDSSNLASRELIFDVNRFLAKYFLDGLNGKPDPMKTPDPIAVSAPIRIQRFPYEAAISRVPELELCYLEMRHYVRRVVIGWGRDKVEGRKREIQAEEARVKAEREAAEMAEKDEDWKFSLPAHHAYLENYQPPSGLLDLDRLVGKYIVRCDKLDDYATSTKAMSIEASTKTMHIHPRSERSARGLVAAFDFDMIAGTMLLGNSDDAVHQLSQDMYDSSDGDWSECYDSDLDGDLSDSRKRKAKNESISRPIKRRLGEAPRPNRVYLLWGGRETGEGEIQVDTANGQSGYLDFDEQTATAQGQFSYPTFFGAKEPVGFSIYKVSDHPSERPEAWARLSEKQWDYECTARWR